MKQQLQDSFKVGAKVIYPSHGLGVIEKIENRQVSGVADAFYIIRIRKNGMTIMAPTRSASTVGLRNVISKNEIPKVMDVLKSGVPDNFEPNWNKRQKFYQEKIKTGSLVEVASVYKALFDLKESKGLSFVEQQVYENAEQLLISEIAESKGIDSGKVEEMLGKALTN